MFPLPTIEAFDDWLAERGIPFEGIVVGGAALALLGVIERQTRDFDMLAPELSSDIAEQAERFAEHMRGQGVELGDDWLNNGPIQLIDILPAGWRERLRHLFQGNALSLSTLGRPDLLKTKLFALCDRGTDLADCIALTPTASEIEEAEQWVTEQDANPLWPNHVRRTLQDLQARIERGV